MAEEMMPAIKGKLVSGIETTVMATGTQYKIVTIDSGIISQAVVHFNRETKDITFISKSETSVSSVVDRVVKKTEVKSTKIDIKTLQSTTVKDITKVIVKENKEIFSVAPIIQSGTFKETASVEIYELKVQTKEKKTTTVKVIKDKKTLKVTVTDITPEIRVVPVCAPSVVTQEDSFGNFEVTTTNKKVIKESK